MSHLSWLAEKHSDGSRNYVFDSFMKKENYSSEQYPTVFLNEFFKLFPAIFSSTFVIISFVVSVDFVRQTTPRFRIVALYFDLILNALE